MNDEERKQKEAAVEAILFTMGSAVEEKVLMEALKTTEEETDDILARLQEKYMSKERGLQLIRLENSYQLCTKPEFYQELVTVATTPIRPVLTEVMLEVLSIIAYKQPVTKLEIERIRGVSCEYAVNRLVELGLVEEAGRAEAPGRPILFQTTEEFLRKFGLSSVRELPPLSEEIMRKAAEDACDTAGFSMEGQISFISDTGDENLLQMGHEGEGSSDAVRYEDMISDIQTEEP